MAAPHLQPETEGVGGGADGEADDDADVLDRLDDAQSARSEGASVD